MREEVPTPDTTLRPPADVSFRPYSSQYSEQDRRTRKVNKQDAQRTLNKRRRKRKQERRNKKGK